MLFKRLCYFAVADEIEIDIEKEWKEFYKQCKAKGNWTEEELARIKEEDLNAGGLFSDFIFNKYYDRKPEKDADFDFKYDFSWADCWENEYVFDDSWD